MNWLLNRYFLPTLSPPTIASFESIELPPLEPLLVQYKSFMKAVVRDTSLQGRNKADMDRLLRGFSAWIADVSALYAANLSGQGTDSSTLDQKLKLATQRFCERLCGRGGLVPVSKR